MNIKEALLFILVFIVFALCTSNKDHINKIETKINEPSEIEAPILEQGLKTYLDDRPFKRQELPGENNE